MSYKQQFIQYEQNSPNIIFSTAEEAIKYREYLKAEKKKEEEEEAEERRKEGKIIFTIICIASIGWAITTLISKISQSK